MTEPEIYAALSDIFEDVFMRPVELRPDLTAKDVAGWDSLKQIDIIISVEERFGVKAGTKELDGLQSVGDLVGLIKTRLG